MTSTRPDAPSSWKLSELDPGGVFEQVRCPSASLCVAVDRAGNVWTSTDPRGGASTWSSAAVDLGSGLNDVSCPRTTLCVAVGGGDVAFSNSPAAGGDSWQLVSNVHGGLGGPECGKYGGTSGCYSIGLESVSCPATTLCVAADNIGGGVRSTDPARASGWPVQNASGGEGDYQGPIVCPSTGFCLEQCAVGVGFSGAECQGDTYDAGDVIVDASKGGYDTIAPAPLLGLWCASVALCFAGDEQGHLYASTDPGTPKSAWPGLYSTLPANTTRYDPIQAVACPSTAFCLAVDYHGRLISGSPPPTRTQLLFGLRSVLRRATKGSTTRQLLRTGGKTETFTALMPSRLSITWRQRATGRVLAKGIVTFRAAERRRIAIKLTRIGRRVLGPGHQIHVIAVARLVLPAGETIVATVSDLVRG